MRPDDFGCRFDALIANIGAAPGNDDHIEALHQVATELWILVEHSSQQAEFFAQVAHIERKAEQWARDADLHKEKLP